MRRDPETLNKRQPALEAIERSGHHLLAMINDVLDLSRIEAGKMELHAGDFDLMALIRDLSVMFQLQSHEKGLAWKSVVYERQEAPDSMMVRGDQGNCGRL